MSQTLTIAIIIVSAVYLFWRAYAVLSQRRSACEGCSLREACNRNRNHCKADTQT